MSAPAARRPRRWTLRARLLAVLLTLLLTVCAVVGVVTVYILRGSLVDRLDAQLAAARNRSQHVGAPPASATQRDDPTRFVVAPGQAAGTLGVVVQDRQVRAAAVLSETGDPVAVSSTAVAAVATLPTNAAPRTIVLGSLGAYRVVSSTTATGDVLVTGLPLKDVDRTVDQLIIVELLVAGVAVAAAAGTGVLVMRRTLRPLQRVAATATRVSTLPLARGEVEIEERLDEADVDDRTEVGQVAGSVNRLLDHVHDALQVRQESETKVRRFVADASHELRTPLTAIRGYAELTRRDRADAPPQLAFAMERVESEATRMTAMVEDLLLLARLDAGRELAAAPVDLTHLLLNAVSDANASSRDHQWHLRLPDEPIETIGDAGALHQVVANLLANARVHTPAGTTVTVTLSSSSPDDAVITVLDDGPGIAPEMLPTIFERFARGAESRTRESGSTSTGLGLAIVHAIVEAHGGTIQVTSRPGQTAFVVRLPTGTAA